MYSISKEELTYIPEEILKKIENNIPITKINLIAILSVVCVILVVCVVALLILTLARYFIKRRWCCFRRQLEQAHNYMTMQNLTRTV